MIRSIVLSALALSVLLFASKPAQAAPGDRLRARVQDCQQRVDQADARCHAIVRDIANAGSPQAVQELNRQLKTWEKTRSDAQFALYQAREQLSNLGRQEALLKADIGAFIQACKQFGADKQSLQGDIDYHNRDTAACDRAVAYFNSLPFTQRSQAEHNRLQRWQNEVHARLSRLQTRQNGLAGRRAELRRWENTLKSRAQQFEGS